MNYMTIEGGLTITVRKSEGDKGNHEVLEKVGKALNFTGCGSQSSIFGLRGRLRYYSLFLQDFQEIKEEPRKIQNPIMEQQETGQMAQSKSAGKNKGVFGLMLG